MAYEIPKVKADGTLTDYGKSLQQREATDQEASRIMSTYKQPKEIEYVGGVYKNYEDYVGTNAGGSVMSREQHAQLLNERQQQEMNDRQNRESNSNSGQQVYNGQNLQQPLSSSVNNIKRQDSTSIATLQQQIADAQRKNDIANLEQLYQKNVGGLTAERGKIDPLYAGQTRQAVAQGEMRKKSFSDFLAEKGLSASGQAGQGEISQNIATANELGGIEARRGEAISDIERRLTDVTQARDFGIAGANTQADRYLAEQQLSGALRQQQIDREDALRQQSQQREDQLRLQGYSREDAQRQAELERRTQAENETKAQQENERKRSDFAAAINPKEDLTAKIDLLISQGVPEDDYRVVEYKKARLNKIANMDQNNFERELANIKAEEERQEVALEYAWKKFNSGLPADAVTARLLGINAGTVIPEQKIKEAQLVLDKQKTAIAQQNANKTSTSKSDTKQDKENWTAFEVDFSNVLSSDPSRAKGLLNINRDEIIRQKGLSKYNSLLSQADKAVNEFLKRQQDSLKNSKTNFYTQE